MALRRKSFPPLHHTHVSSVVFVGATVHIGLIYWSQCWCILQYHCHSGITAADTFCTIHVLMVGCLLLDLLINIFYASSSGNNCGLFLPILHTPWSVCLSVGQCWAHYNQLKCCLGVAINLCGSKEPYQKVEHIGTIWIICAWPLCSFMSDYVKYL